MTDSISIPADVARMMADYFREIVNGTHPNSNPGEGWADLLDPQPPTLREQTIKVIEEYLFGRVSAGGIAALAERLNALHADWLAAQPLVEVPGYIVIGDAQRDHDVRLIRDGGTP